MFGTVQGSESNGTENGSKKLINKKLVGCKKCLYVYNGILYFQSENLSLNQICKEQHAPDAPVQKKNKISPQKEKGNKKKNRKKYR